MTKLPSSFLHMASQSARWISVSLVDPTSLRGPRGHSSPRCGIPRKPAAHLLCSTAYKRSGRSRQPRCSLGPLVPTWVCWLFVSPLSQDTCPLLTCAFFLEENDDSLSKLGWEAGFELFVSVRCLGSFHHAHPHFQLECSAFSGSGLLPPCSPGSPLHGSARALSTRGTPSLPLPVRALFCISLSPVPDMCSALSKCCNE